MQVMQDKTQEEREREREREGDEIDNYHRKTYGKEKKKTYLK